MSPTAQPTSIEGASPAVVLPARLIQDGEQIILAIKPSGFFVLLTSVPFILAAVLAVLAAQAVDFLLPSLHLPVRTVLVAAVGLSLLRVLVAAMQWLARVYVLTDRRIIRVKGVLRVNVFECPLTRVQNTVLTLTVAERLFGLGSLWFATAGTGAMEAAWVMIARPTEVHEITVQAIRRAQSGNGAAQM